MMAELQTAAVGAQQRAASAGRTGSVRARCPN